MHNLEHAYRIRAAAQDMLSDLRQDMDEEYTVVDAVLVVELRPTTQPDESSTVATFTSTSPWTTLGLLTASQSQMMARMHASQQGDG